MKPTCLILLASLSAFSANSALSADQTSERFTAIAARNAFRLSPPKPPASEIPPPPNRSKVSFQGITTILGRTLALLTIEPAAKPAEFFQTSCVLAQGESRFDVVVLEINATAGTVRLDNLGTDQTLTLKR
jgi:hypothetical protein